MNPDDLVVPFSVYGNEDADDGVEKLTGENVKRAVEVQREGCGVAEETFASSERSLDASRSQSKKLPPCPSSYHCTFHVDSRQAI